MFVDKLTREQIQEFVRTNLKVDVHPEVCRFQTDFVDFQGEWAYEIHYASKMCNALRSIFLTDGGVYPMVTEDFEDTWIKYLYSVFGEEYKDWYLSKNSYLPQKCELFY